MIAMNVKDILSVVAIVTSAACSQQSNVLTVEVPVRPAGQEDAILMTAEPIDFTRGSWNKVQGYRHAFID